MCISQDEIGYSAVPSHLVIPVQRYAVHTQAGMSHHTSFTVASKAIVHILEMPLDTHTVLPHWQL